jgi:aspartyl-tRNA synthetase
MFERTGDSGPSKNELKKRAKAAEKEKKAAEKLAKQQELAQQKAAAEVVRLCGSLYRGHCLII